MTGTSTELVRVGLDTSTLREESNRSLLGEPLPGSWLRPTGILANMRFLWRTSLPYRVTLVAVGLTTLTVLVVGLVMGHAIARDLYSSRVSEIVSEADRAGTAARAAFAAGAESDETVLTSLRQQALQTASEQAANSRGYAFYRAPQTSSSVGLQNIASDVQVAELITDELRTAVRGDSENLHYQSVALPGREGEGDIPGVIVGTGVNVPTVGMFEYYLVYSLEGSQQTLDFVQRTLVVSMVILVLLVAVIVGGITRAVIRPIRTAARASLKLADGELGQRVPVRGEDDLGVLARSFNQMADNLQRQIEQLEHLSKVQQRFVSDVSHELRTPLTTIRLAGGIVYARRDEFDKAFARSAELLHDQIGRFELLLNDLLEISRYDAGAVEMLRKPTSLGAIADDVIGSMSQVALDHGVELIFLEPERLVEAEFDERRITRVVRNLIANAIEHSEGRPIVITVDSNATAVAISVRDYGLGMAPNQAEHVFERFWRADPSRKRTMGGSGLGLAISQEDAQLHGGWLQVWSRPGMGSNFRLTLPRTAGSSIVSSPLPLEPEDAGAEAFQAPSYWGYVVRRIGAVDDPDLPEVSNHTPSAGEPPASDASDHQGEPQ